MVIFYTWITGQPKDGYVVLLEKMNAGFTILVNNDFHKRGIGRSLVELGREQHKSINGWVIETSELPKIKGDLYRSPMGFYLKTGFRRTKIHTEANSSIKTVKISWVNKPFTIGSRPDRLDLQR